MSDPKLVSREKKIFDASGKIKDRFKLLVGVVEEEFTSQDITSMYRRRAQNVVDLYQGYVGQLGKVLTLEQALPVIEVLRRVLVVMHDSVRDGWCQEYLGDEVERYLHIENHLSIRKIGLKLLLLYIDAVGSDCLGLLLSVFDWNTLRLMSDPQPGLFLPPSVRVLTEKRHSFIPKKVGYKEDDNAQRDTMITFTEVFDFLSCTRERNPSYERIQFRWSLFKSTLAPILFPHCVHRGISFATSNIGFQGIFPGLTSIVLNSLLFPILSLETSCGVILDDVEDFLLVNYIFRHALRASPFDDLLPCYRALQIYQSWVHAPKHQTCITQKYCILESILAVFLNLQTPIPEQSAVQARLAMFEVACDIFVRLQDKGEDERSIRLWIDKAVVPVYKGADLGIQICEQAAEMVSRSLWSQILIANVQSNDLWDSLSTFLSSVLNTCGQGMSRGKGTSSSQAFQRISIQTVPHTDVVAQAVSPLVLHWRIIIGNILRQIIGHCSETAVTRPYNCLALSALDWSSVVDQTPGRRSDSPVGDVVSLNNKLSATQLGNSISMSSSDSPVEDYIQSNQVFQVMLPSSSRSANMSMNSHDDGDVPLDISTPFNLSSSNNKTVMSLHRQSESERKNISAPPETWIEKLPVEQIISLWIKLLKCLTFPGMERAIHPLHFISISHTVSDVINDLLFCSSSHRVIEPWKRGAPTQMDPPSHLLASTQRPISLQNSSVSASLVAHLAVEVQIRYLEYQLGSTCDYNISAKAIAMGSLCDLLRHGGKLPSEQLSKIKTLILRALSPGEESVTRVILYRLYPVSVSDVTHYGHTQHFLEHHHEDSISLLAPLVISIKDYVQFRGKSPTQSNTKRSKIDSETPVKTAAASTLTWCAAYASGLIAQGKNTITWPDEYESHNATVETYEEILEIIKKTLIDLTYENQPVATRITAIKGLAVAALVTLDSCKILQVLCQCILDISTDIALSAQTAIESVLLSIDATKISHESVLSEACSFLATALIVSLRHFIPTRHSVTVTESLLYSLTEVILSKPDIIDNPTILLVTDSMSYACQSKVRRSYWVPDTPKSYCDIPCIASSVQLHNGSYEYMSSSEEHLWWYNLDLTDETVLATIEGIRCTAEVAMDHLTGLFRNFPVCAATDSSTSSQAAPDIKAVGGENVYLNQNSKALITLSELPNDPKTVYLTSRTTTGRYCWELRRVGINGVKSSFPMVPDSTAGVGHGQARSQSGALIGRSRTKALHESSCLNSGCDLNNKLSQAMTDLMPSYLSEPSTGPPVHWTEQFKDCVAADDQPDAMTDIQLNMLDNTLTIVDGDRTQQQLPPMPHSQCKDFLATGPLLSYRTTGMVLSNESAVFPEELRILNTLETDRMSLHQQLYDVDQLNSRDLLSISIVFVLPGQTSASAILGNGESSTSNQYDQFLQSLGWNVNLSSHVGFTGGLEYDPEAHPTMLYFASPTIEIAYHVTTLVGLTEEEVAIEQRRRLIAADPLQIIWCEGEENYNPSIISAPHVQFWIIVNRVRSCGDLVRISLSQRVPLPPSAPLIDGMCLPTAQAAHLVRCFCRCVLVPHRLQSALSRKEKISDITPMFKRDVDNQNLSQAALSLFVRQARVAT